MDRLRVISLGWGLQSFALAAMAALGELEPVDAAIFADTGHERQASYEFARVWTPWLEARGVPVVTVRASATAAVREYQTGRRVVMIPAFGSEGGMIRRQCTRDWKVDPIKRWCRSRGGQSRGTEMLLGITLDEVTRCKPSRVAYIRHRWPFVELEMTRDDVRAWLVGRGLEVPPRSACVMCPFQSGAEWRSLSSGDRDLAVGVDESIRDVTRRGSVYAHRSRIPLREVRSRIGDEPELWDNECSGFCHS